MWRVRVPRVCVFCVCLCLGSRRPRVVKNTIVIE